MSKPINKTLFFRLFKSDRFKKRNELFLSNGEELLRRFVKVMDANSLTYWMEFGTLLGAYRDKDFIAHDCDLDFGAHLEDARKIYVAMTSVGFTLLKEYHVVGENGLEQTYEYGGTTLDVFYFTSSDGHYRCNSFFHPQGDFHEAPCLFQVAEFDFSAFETVKIPFKGIEVAIPANTEQHLLEVYGEKFMIPDPNFRHGFNKTRFTLDEKRGFGFYLK